MTGVVYAIRISDLEYSGPQIMDVKIGKSTDIKLSVDSRYYNKTVDSYPVLDKN